jgi:hypothetical protein
MKQLSLRIFFIILGFTLIGMGTLAARGFPDRKKIYSSTTEKSKIHDCSEQTYILPVCIPDTERDSIRFYTASHVFPIIINRKPELPTFQEKSFFYLKKSENPSSIENKYLTVILSLQTIK